MKPFNLEAALAGVPVITRDGKPVEVIGCSKSTKLDRPLIVVMKDDYSDKDTALAMDKDGRYDTYGAVKHESSRDLFMATTKRKYCVVILKHTMDGRFSTSRVLSEQDAALYIAEIHTGNWTYVTTIEFEVEE